MKHSIIILFCALSAGKASAQKIDSIFFNLYTDSLKKGTYNYINVEGRYSDGHYLPLGEKELRFSASGGRFSGNSLFIDSSFREDKVKVKVSLTTDPSQWKETTIYIKKTDGNTRLPTVEEIMDRPPVRKRRSLRS